MISQNLSDDIAHIATFLVVPTPQAWIDWALENEALMLIDHAHCEKKAASTALGMMYRYVEFPTFLHRLSKLAREELVHFEQVLKIMQKRGIEYGHLTAAHYASELMKMARKEEPWQLVDKLIIGALIEARSCERFAALAPRLDPELQTFYLGLLKSEARHFEIYLRQARDVAPGSIDERINQLRQRENELIQSTSAEFRFHSGVPMDAESSA
ncbi:tRNA-(ms[2]io[6]A)-hydroxylase [Salinispirillum marinum]|uniref:tRNA-(Ms[2]io[6]A)-hydroxylase n=2 Tax=Saccharospirillaceae TaxID=255527 RepID=A0ABV8BDU2_9GAMM